MGCGLDARYFFESRAGQPIGRPLLEATMNPTQTAEGQRNGSMASVTNNVMATISTDMKVGK